MRRRFPLTRVDSGDYLLLSNDGRGLWRIYRYEENGSLEVFDGDHYRVVQGSFWCVAHYDGTAWESDDDLLTWDSRWIVSETLLRTRKDALGALGFDP